MTEQADAGASDDIAALIGALQRGGYPLEMEVARRALEHGARPSVEQGRLFVDPIEHKVREADVIATFSAPQSTREHLRVEVRLILECKTNTLPWVIFDANQSPTENVALRLDWAPTRENRPRVDEWEIRSEPYYTSSLLRPSRIGFSLAAVPMKGSKEVATDLDGRNQAWSATKQAASAALGVLADTRLPEDDSSAIRVLHFPVVVVQGLLYRAWLDPDIHEVAAEPIRRGEYRVRLSGDLPLVRCFVVTLEGLQELFDHAGTTAILLREAGYRD